MFENITKKVGDNKTQATVVIGIIIVALCIAVYAVASANPNDDEPYAQAQTQANYPFVITMGNCINYGFTESTLHNHGGTLYTDNTYATKFNGCLPDGAHISTTRHSGGITISYPSDTNTRKKIVWTQYVDGKSTDGIYCPPLAGNNKPQGRPGTPSIARWDWSNCSSAISGKQLGVKLIDHQTYQGIIQAECLTTNTNCTSLSAPTPLTKPANITLTPGGRSGELSVSWDKVTNAGPVYEVQYCLNTGSNACTNTSAWTFVQTGQSYTDPANPSQIRFYTNLNGLQSGSYKVRVKAMGGGLYDNSPWSDEQSVTI